MLPNRIRIPAAVLLVAVTAALGFLYLQAQQVPNRKRLEVELSPPAVLPTQLIDVAPQDAREINAKVPVVTTSIQKARPFSFDGQPLSRERAIDCLAAAEWYEAGDDPTGERAVAQVVLNRARHPAFPMTVCGVVFQGAERKTGCQFTFACDGSMARTPAPAIWERARAIAMAALNGQVMPSVGYATHYHADYVVPYWQTTLDKIAVIGAHLFYRWQGYWGTPAAFRRKSALDEPVIAQLARLSPAHLDPVNGVVETALTASTDVPAVAATLAEKTGDSSTNDLRGSETRFAASDGRTIFLKLDPAAFPGTYASAALGVCQGKSSCQVLGWRDPEKIGAGLPLNVDQSDALSFIYIRKNGSDAVMWNCKQTPRTAQSQCMPHDAAAIRQLFLNN